MSESNVICPECRQAIRNAVPSGGKYRCGACGCSFAATDVASTPHADDLSLQMPASSTPSVLSPVPTVTPAAAVVRAPLGRMPASASYGLAQAVGWALVIFAVVSSGWTMNTLLRPREINPSAMMGLTRGGSMPSVKMPAATMGQILETGLGGAQSILLALLVVCAASIMTRLDTRASWLAWRSESLADPIGEPPGSSLPFILPLCVAGGVWVYLSMSAGTVVSGIISSMVGFMDMSGLNVVFVAVGLLVFLIGLGCGEVRRFFWRMEQFGKALPRRKRGDELSMGVPRKYYARPERTGSDKYMLCLLILLLIVYTVIAWQILGVQERMNGMMSGRGMMPGMDVAPNDVSRQLWVMILTGFIGIVGGAYTTYRLSLLWSEMMHSWNWASQSVGSVRGPHFGSISTGRISMLGRITGWGILGITVYGFFRIFTSMGPGQMQMVPGFVILLAVCFPLLLACFVWWLAGLKRDSYSWVGATAALASDEPEKSPLFDRIRLMSLGVMLILAVRMGLALYQLASMGGGGGTGNLSFDAIAGIVYLLLLAIAYTVIPVIWWALTVRDLNRVSEHLESCGEVL